ncbi:hypothetical protein JTB14_029783 [Gonioctena quinquepunctata]|nr:hypothetical protein JTB14_029783 [Gonioctena quinquepunctata]
MFKLQANLDISPSYLLEELFFRVHDLTKWNTALKESHKVQSLDEHTDITYQISKEAVGGLVSSRDFIILRHWASVEKYYVISHCKTEHPSLPENKKFTRGETGVGCSVIEPSEDPRKCTLHWIVDTDLKMWILNSVFKKEMANMMFQYAKDLRNHLSSKKIYETAKAD